MAVVFGDRLANWAAMGEIEAMNSRARGKTSGEVLQIFDSLSRVGRRSHWTVRRCNSILHRLE
jgi:hypothetical protein